MIYPKEKIKIRFCNNGKKQCTAKQMLSGILPALWDKNDEPKVIDSIEETVRKFNNNCIFFYPFALDNYKTRLLDLCVGGFYQIFPWDLPEEDIHPLCQLCINFENIIYKEKPILSQGSVAVFRCPKCGNIIVDDILGWKGSGEIQYLTKKQFKIHYGIDI